MAKQKKKPVTKKDIVNILTAILQQTDALTRRLKDIDSVFIDFIEFSSDINKFEKWLDGKYKPKEHIGSGKDSSSSEE
jgi:hypothetical protein